MPDALRDDDTAKMAEAVTDPRLVGESQLVGTFRGSRGFGLVCRRDALPQVRERFRALVPFLDLLEATSPAASVRRWPRLRVPEVNALYINVLIVDEGKGVGRHVDGTLQDPAGRPGITPEVVSVLYLAIPERRAGGELVLYQGSVQRAVIDPAPGALLHFRGDLAHEIRPLEGAVGPRVSVIAEQYALDEEALARLPRLSLQSRAPDPVFAAGPKRPGTFAERVGAERLGTGRPER